jgi:hypothetical protein
MSFKFSHFGLWIDTNKNAKEYLIYYAELTKSGDVGEILTLSRLQSEIKVALFLFL